MNENYSCRHIFNDLTAHHGVHISPAIELSDLSVVYNMVNSGMGVSLVSDTSLSFYDSENLEVQKVESPPLKRNVVMHHNGAMKTGGLLDAFHRMIIQELERLNIIR